MIVGKVRCPWCRRPRVSLTRRGKLWTHKPNLREDTGEFLDWCAGAGRLPAEYQELAPLRRILEFTGVPSPGGKSARAQGCVCPARDNNHGRWAPQPPRGWFVSPDCPVHARR